MQTLGEKKEWNIHFEKHIRDLDKKKPVIWTGDLNVAPTALGMAFAHPTVLSSNDRVHRSGEPQDELEQDSWVHRSRDQGICTHPWAIRCKRVWSKENDRRMEAPTSRTEALYVLLLSIWLQKERPRLATRYLWVSHLESGVCFRPNVWWFPRSRFKWAYSRQSQDVRNQKWDIRCLWSLSGCFGNRSWFVGEQDTSYSTPVDSKASPTLHMLRWYIHAWL